jgi:hypothetical protein
MIARNKAFIGAGGGYTSNATTTFGQATITQPPWTSIYGYSAYRGDNGYATLTLTTNTGLTGLLISNFGFWIQNIVVNCSGLATSNGISVGSNLGWAVNCKAVNFTNYGFTSSGQCHIMGCEVFGGGASSIAVYAAGGGMDVEYCYIHDNANIGIRLGGGNSVIGNIFANNAGAEAIQGSNANICEVVNNTVCYNSSAGISMAVNYSGTQRILGNLIVGNGTWGFSNASAGDPALPAYDGNAYYGNASGTRQYADDLGATNPINGVAPYVNTHDVILSSTPFVKASATLSDGFTNTTANQFGSSSYTFVSGDVGATLFIQNTTGGWTGGEQFTISSVAGGIATLNYSPGGSSLTGGIWHFDNYQLNTNAGGGAACTGFAVPTLWPGNASTISYPSFGAVDPTHTGDGGTTYIFNVES